MSTKPKTPQKENLNGVDGRDLFQSPNYAVDILLPYLEYIKPISPRKFRIWECAAGQGKIVSRLEHFGYDIYGSDLRSEKYPVHNFLTQSNGQDFDCVITNPPFSLKRKFYEMCVRYGRPFALLIPADYSGWIIKAVGVDKCEKIIPSRRIDYITPDALNRIHEGEVWKLIEDKKDCESLRDYKKNHMNVWIMDLWVHNSVHNYKSLEEVPSELLAEYSTSQFHSMWMTWGFGLGRTETFVELTNEMKNNI